LEEFPDLWSPECLALQLVKAVVIYEMDTPTKRQSQAARIF
jgi:hypothetical protein